MRSFRSRCAIHVFLFQLILLAFAISCGVIPAHADQSQSFAWVADTRGDANNDLISTNILTPIVDSILALNPAPKVVIFGGDAAYRGGYDTGATNLTQFQDVFTNRLAAKGIPSAFAIGNHELYTMNHAPNLWDQALSRQEDFNKFVINKDSLLPKIQIQNVPGHPELNNLAFSFYLGNSLFIIPDSYLATANGTEPSYGINAAQQTWMKSLLENNKAAHTFVLTHIPAYTPQDPSAENNMKDTWQTITTSGNATNTNASILFTGHQHLYYRTLHDGTYEVLAGSGGAPLGCEQGESCNNLGPVYPGDVFWLRYNYAVTSINGREVTVSVFDQANSSLDIFSFFDNSGVNNTVINNAIAIAPDANLQQPTGILAASGNTITNSASISNVFTGIDAVHNNTITNSGSITPLSGGNGILVYDNNTITNTATGSITGNSTGLWGIRVNTGNTINNNGTVTVSGTNSIAFLAQGDNNTLTNTGTLSASGTGSYAAKFMGTGNGLVNSNTGTISGNLWFDAGNNTLTNNGTINGSGGLYKNGSGTLTLLGNGTTSYTGGTTVNGGLLLVNNTSGSGTGTGSVTVGSSGSLGGSGTIGGNVINSGTVSPGSSSSSIGTLTISGGSSYSQNNTGKLQVKIGSPTSNDLLKVGGSANIDGTLETLWQGGAVPANRTVFGTILSATGVSGKFANIIGNKITPTLFLKPQYDRANEVYLMAESDYTASDLVSTLSGNQLAVAQMLNPLANSASGDLNTVMSKIDALTTNAQVAAAFDQLSPIASVAQTNMTSGVASFQTGNVASRLGDLRQGAQGFSFQGLENLDFLYPQGPRQPFLLASNSDDLQGMIPVAPDPNWGFFVRGNLVLGDQKDTAEQRGYDFKNGGLTLGTDYRFSEQFVCGALFGMNAAKSWINDAGSTVKLDGYTLGLYGTYFRNDFYIDTQAGYGWNNFDNSRRIVFPGIDRTATSSPSGSQVTAYGGTGYDFNFGSWTVGPSLTFQYLWMGVNGYTESGADSLNLQVDRQTTESYQGSAGIKGSWNWKRDKLRFVPRLWGFYRHEFGNVNPATNAALAQGSSAFTIASVAPERNYFNVGTGVNVHWTDRVLAYLNYDAQLGQSAYSAQSITIGLRLQF